MTPHRPDGDAVDASAAALTEASAVTTEMQELFALTDWGATQLGAVDTWPAPLRTIVDICLSSRFPMLICWGPDLVMIYNDGYRTMLGQSKHPPSALGPSEIIGYHGEAVVPSGVSMGKRDDRQM